MKLASFVFGSIALLIRQYADYYKENDLQKTLTELESDSNLPKITTYDFIIVGGGTAGCLIAGRLSEKFSVLLLERGGTPVPATANPFLRKDINEHPSINSIFLATPQFNFEQENGARVKIHTGRMLGGSGSHNENLYNRGSPLDYDNLANITGDSTWSHKNVLKHFKNFENFVGELVKEDEREAFYATGGPLTVNTLLPPILQPWFQAAQELGYKIGDSNGHQSEGFTPVIRSIKNSEKESTYTAFVKPYESTRRSLTVMRYSEVEQVLVNENKVAYGVIYKRHGIPQIAHASKEVIVSCGTISSPLLLIKSGIGPKTTLNKANIPIIRVLEGVGKNLRDHAAVVLSFTVRDANTTLFPRIKEEDLEGEIKKYHEPHRSGFLTEVFIAQSFIVSSRARKDGEPNWPDIQIFVVQEPIIGEGIQTIPLPVVLNRPKSVGEIKMDTDAYLRGERDDRKLAEIDLRHFSEPSDAEVLIEGITLGLRIMENTTGFKNMDIVYTQAPPVRCKNLTPRSHEFWDCYVRERGQMWNHFAGTCQMGMENELQAVVNSKLEVHGITGLRVVDASVLPRPPNANLNGAVMLVAEKASQDILEKYSTP